LEQDQIFQFVGQDKIDEAIRKKKEEAEQAAAAE
jgi:hypothetical protein